jgi:hypothetical protein
VGYEYWEDTDFLICAESVRITKLLEAGRVEQDLNHGSNESGHESFFPTWEIPDAH